MATCNISIDSFQSYNGTLKVSEKYAELMQASLGEDSIYMRAKDTLAVQFDKLGITEDEKAKLVLEFVSGITSSMSAISMQTALQWSKEERDGAIALAKLEADTKVSIAQAAKIKEELCLVEAQVAKVQAEKDSIIATTAAEVALKEEQKEQVKASTYQIFADAYRKSGVVVIGTDNADDITKGLSGDDAGYTNQQSKNAERQRIAYEDSKRNHAANSSASMIGQMLSAEIAPNDADVQRWRDAVDFLNNSHSTTSQS